MPESALGSWLRGLREATGLSLREVAQRGEVDHAYVYRLETGAKESPSGEVIEKLASALKSSKRDGDILRFLAERPGTDVGLVEFARRDASVTTDEFRMLTTFVNRGARPDYPTALARIRKLMQEEGDG
jgi:transcriptional regulator with XRE-family HTH domain